MITLSKEEFEQKYGVQPQNKGVTLSKEEFEQKYNIDNRSGLNKVTDFFFGNTKKLGETFGTALSVNDEEVTKQREGALTSEGEAESNILKLIQQAKTQSPEMAKRTMDNVKRMSEEAGVDIFNNPEYQKTAKQVYGEALGTLGETLQFSSFGSKGAKSFSRFKDVPTIAKPLTVGKDIAKGAKIGAGYGGAFGAGFGVSNAMQEDKSLGDIAKAGLTEGAIGLGAGAVLGGGLSTVARGLSGATAKASKLVAVTKKAVGEKVYSKLVSVSNDLMKMSPTQTRNETKWNKNTPKFLVDEGVIGLVDSDGKKIVTEEAVSALRDKYHAESRAFNNLLTDSGEYVSLNDFKNKAIKSLGDEFKNKGTDYKKAIKKVENEIQAYKENYRKDGLIEGDDLHVNISDFNKIKIGLWAKTTNFNPSQADKLLSDVSYRMGQTAKGLIEDTVEDVAVKRMNSRLGDFASAIQVLERANGKVLPGGFFGRAFTRLTGTIAGSGGGVPGSIIGNLTGGVLADVMANPKYKTAALSKFLKLVKKKPNGQSLIDEANEILIKRGEERSSRLLLGESKAIPVGPKTDDSFVKMVDAKKAFGRDPKTGRFKRVYTSKGSQEAFGVVAGMEMDEDGNVSFDPKKALAGMAVMGITSNGIRISTLQKGYDNLSKRIGETTTKSLIRDLNKARKGINKLIGELRKNEKGFQKLPGKADDIESSISKAKAEGKSLINSDVEDIIGTNVEYLGEKYVIKGQRGIRGDMFTLEGDYGKQLSVPKTQVKKIAGEKNLGLENAMQHRPSKSGVASNIPQDSLPDFYEQPNLYHYGGKEYDESVKALMEIRNKPNKEITIYRAGPKNELRNGDWITLSKEKARLESIAENVPVNSFKVKVKDIQFAGDDITEFGYWGKQLWDKGADTIESTIKKAKAEGKSFDEWAKITEPGDNQTRFKDIAKDIEIKNFGDDGVFQFPPTKINRSAVEKWKTKISEGERPIIITGGAGFPRIVDGTHRITAYKELGFKEVPTIFESELKQLWDKQ